MTPRVGNMLVLVTMALLTASWFVQMGGLAALTYLCNNTPPALSNGLIAMGMTDASFFARMAFMTDAYGATYTPTCSENFSFHWWVVMAEFVLIVGIMITWARQSLTSHHNMTRVAWMCCLAILAALNWLFAARFAFVHWGLYDFKSLIPVTFMRVNVTWAGCILISIFNVVAIFVLGALRPQAHSRVDGEPKPIMEPKPVAGEVAV